MGCGGACADMVEDAGLGMEGKKVRVSEVATLLPESLKDRSIPQPWKGINEGAERGAEGEVRRPARV